MELSSYIRLIKKRLWEQNRNWLCVICGETGSGKSWRALRMAELIDNNFTKEKIFFRSMDLTRYSVGAKRGDVLMWDEAGIGEGASKRNWYSIQNKAINDLFQTARHQNYAVILTLPSLSFLDSGLINLIHTYIECIRTDYKKDAVFCKVRRVQHNPEVGRLYKKNYRFVMGRTYKLNNMWIRAPQNKKLLEYYEEAHKSFKLQKAEATADHLEEMAEKIKIDPHKPPDISQIVKSILDNTDKYTKKWNNKTIIDVYKVQNDFNVGEGVARRIKSKVLSINPL